MAQLREKEEHYIQEARGAVDLMITRGVPPEALKNVKEVERERTKCTKVKRKLKLQVSLCGASSILPAPP